MLGEKAIAQDSEAGRQQFALEKQRRRAEETAADTSDNRCFNPRLWHVQLSGDEGTDYFGNPALESVRWWQRLFTDLDFWQRWIDRWTDLRRGVLSTNHIFATIDGFTAQLTQAGLWRFGWRERSRSTGAPGAGPCRGSAGGRRMLWLDSRSGNVRLGRQVPQVGVEPIRRA